MTIKRAVSIPDYLPSLFFCPSILKLIAVLLFFHIYMIKDSFARHLPYYSQEGMVVSEETFATRVGFEVLRSGGNAADAAVAVGFALSVTLPSAGNLGGGGFLVYREPSGKVHTLDYREKAPAKANPKMFLRPDGLLDAELSRRSLLACGVPGSVSGMLKTLDLFGSGNLTREEIMAGALRLAEEGFPVSYELHQRLKSRRRWLASHPSTAVVFYSGGKVPEAGFLLRQPDLGLTLREIAARGKDGFYKGWVADSLVSFMTRKGGLISRKDLASFTCVTRKPIVFDYRDYRLYGMPPPSSGGFTIGQILGLLAPFNLEGMGHNSAAYVHCLTEAERLSFADRNYFLGDPDFVKIPLDILLSGSYLNKRRKLMPPANVAGKSLSAPHGVPEAMETTHFSVVDSQGGAAAVTTTLNGSFGMGAVVPGAGFFLNNEMDDFTAAPNQPNMFGLVQGEANQVRAGKRMLSAMTPTIVTHLDRESNERLFLVLGAAGGPQIITSVLQIFLNTTLFGMNVREAVEVPRFHHQHLPDAVYLESAFPRDTREILRQMGYELKNRQYIGRAAAIAALPGGLFAGWSDGVGAGAGTGF